MDEKQMTSEWLEDEAKPLARFASVLEVFVGREMKRPKQQRVVVTLGAADGVVESFGLTPDEGRQLLRRLLDVYRSGGVLGDPLAKTKSFLIPHSVGRAKIATQYGSQRMFENLLKDMPEIGEYVRSELAAIEAALPRASRSKKSAARLMEKVKLAMLIAIDAARIDT